MSASVKAALAAKRAEATKANHNAPSNSQDESGFTITPWGSPKKQLKKDLQEELKREMEAALSIGQLSEEAALLKACTSGRLVLSSRSPALQNIPPAVYSLLGEETPHWYSQGTDSPWYDRADVTSLIFSTNEIVDLEDKIGQFELLQRLDLHSNKLSQLPHSLAHLSNLKHLVLSRNRITSFPPSLLTLDNLVSLDLSHNNLSSLWKEPDVLASRESREKWEKENLEEEGGVWASLIAKNGSPTKKIGPPKPFERSFPLRSLKSLNLSNNKLTNLDLGMKSITRRKGFSNQDEVSQIQLPSKLHSLDLSDNSLSGPLELQVFAGLEDLKNLALGGNGISDEVFLPLISDSGLQAFGNLQNLDLSRCEIDDLSKIETFFASSRTRALGEAESSESRADAEAEPSPIAAAGVSRRQLIRVPGQQPETSVNPFATSVSATGKIPDLFVILERNPLREELFRRKRGPSTLASGKKVRAVSSGVTDAVNGSGRSSESSAAPQQGTSLDPTRTSSPSTSSSEAFIDPAIASQGTARPISMSTTSLPPKPAPAKEDWEIQAEQGLMSEGAKRRMRAEAARREREASGGASDSAAPNETQRGRGKNTTGLSDWDGEPAPTSGSRNRGRGTSSSRNASGGGGGGTEDDLDFEDEDLTNMQEGATALSTAKLSTKKKEALGQVPCKFFRANGCSAGNSCPFAHTMPGEGTQKAVCQWFAKGSCRFGHKCALMHILPGQPISMDRKNKRAAQQAQNGKGNANGASGGGSGGGNRKDKNDREDPQWEQQSRDQLAAMQQQQSSTNHFGAVGHRDHDFPFGLPDDMMAPAGSSNFSHLNQVPDQSYPRYSSSGNREASSSLHRTMLSNDVNSSASSQRPVSVPRGANTTPGRGTAMDRGRVSVDNGVPVGSPSAFGTSPFSHPGGHSLFFSGSQDSESTGPFARMASQNFARSMSQFEDSQARARWYGASRGGKDQEELGAGDLNEEDFVPSSLSDLLTPAELERRSRSSRTGALPPQPTTTSSMPAQGGGQGSLWDLNLRTNGPDGGAAAEDVFSTSNRSAAFLSNGRNYDDYFNPVRDGSADPRTETTGIAVGSSQLGGQAFSPGSRAALHHAPGQSLPQGLAAGLSRLHLGTTSGGVADAMRNANGSALGSNSLLPISGNQAISRPSSGMRKDSFGTGTNGTAAYDELGPIAPSSVLPHRPSPLSLAAARSHSNSYGQNFSNSGANNNHLGSSPFSATGSAGGFPALGNQEGIAIPGELSSSHSRRLSGQNSSSNPPSSPNANQLHPGGGSGVQMLGHPRKRPEMDRIRSGAPVPGSPLSYPTKEESEMEDEAIFELE